jgi:DNA-binding beta-propeller fold protein YncE
MSPGASGNLPAAEPMRPAPDGTSSGLLVVCKTDGFVEFYDPTGSTKVEELKLPDFPHEVALAPDRKTAYVSIYGNGIVGTNTRPGTQIAVIDLGQRKRAGFIEVAPYCAPHGMMFDRAGNLWSTAELANSIVVIDVKRGVVIGGVPVGSHRTHWLAVTPDGSKIYTPHRQLNWVSVIDVEKRQLVKRIPNFRYECQGIAIAPDGKRVYQAASARPEITIIDPATDTIAGSVLVEGLGEFPPQHTRLRVTPDNRHLVVTFNVSAMGAVLDTQDLRHQHLFKLEKGPMGMTFKDGQAFITNHDEGSISVIDLAAMKQSGRIATHKGTETLTFY